MPEEVDSSTEIDTVVDAMTELETPDAKVTEAKSGDTDCVEELDAIDSVPEMENIMVVENGSNP